MGKEFVVLSTYSYSSIVLHLFLSLLFLLLRAQAHKASILIYFVSPFKNYFNFMPLTVLISLIFLFLSHPLTSPPFSHVLIEIQHVPGCICRHTALL